MHLNESERQRIGEHARRVEARTGVEVVAALVGKCDAYPEIPWQAFSLASALVAMAGVLAGVAGGDVALPLPGGVAVVLASLGAGACAALATVFLPPFARLFLNAARRDAEVRQYAESFFLARDLVRTERRRAVLVLVGRFERSVVILPDVGVAARLGSGELAAIIVRMQPLLAAGRFAPALHEALDALEALLVGKGFAEAAAGSGGIEREIFEESGE